MTPSPRPFRGLALRSRAPLAFAVLGVAPLIAAACVPEIAEKDDDATTSVATSGTGGTGGASGGGGATTSGGGGTGGAGGSGTAMASSGSGMMCDGGKMSCDGVCVDTASDAKHCGGCGNACGVVEACTGGKCTPISCSSISLDGKDDYLSTALNKGFDYGAAYTIEAWYFGDSTKRFSTSAPAEIADAIFSHGGCCVGVDGKNYFNFLGLNATTNSPKVYWLIDLGTANELASAPTTYDAWHHIAVQQSAAEASVFMDGTKVAMPTGFAMPGPGGAMPPLQVGGNQGNGGPGRFGFGGRLGPQRVSSTFRYKDTFKPTWGWVSDADTLAVWNLTEGMGAMAADGSPNARHLTLSGATWSTEAKCPAVPVK